MTSAIDGVSADPLQAGAHRVALPELPELPERPEPDAGTAAPAGDTLLRGWSPLHQIKARLQVCVGEATVTVGELLAAREQQVLRLDRAVDQPVDLSIDGQVVARGQLVALDGQFAIRLTELPAPLSLAPEA